MGMEMGESSKTKSTIISASSFLRSVTLHDWWLLRTNGNRLAVGGFATRERQGIRVFCSGAIARRHDAATLETVDGITVTIVGFLNRSRTHENGFPSEVCKHFLFGFPYHWEEYAAQCFGGESTKSGAPTKSLDFEEFNMASSSSANANNPLPGSLDGHPVTRFRDLLLSTLGDSENCSLTNGIFDDLLGGVCRFSNMKSNSPMVDTELNRTPSNHKKAKVGKKFKDDSEVVDAPDMGTREFKQNVCQSKEGVDVSIPSRGVSTRSMTRLKNLRNKLEENISSCTPKKQNSSQDSGKCLVTSGTCNDVLRTSSGNDTGKSIKTNSPIKTADSVSDKVLKHKKAKGEQKSKDGYGSLNAVDIRKEELQKDIYHYNAGKHALSPDRGVATRSSSRLKNVRNNPQEHLSSKSSI